MYISLSMGLLLCMMLNTFLWTSSENCSTINYLNLSRGPEQCKDHSNKFPIKCVILKVFCIPDISNANLANIEDYAFINFH